MVAQLKKFPITAELRASIQLSDFEIDARAIIAAARRENFCPGRIYNGLLNVFEKNWESSLSLQRITLGLAAELEADPTNMTGWDIKGVVTKMVRQGYLRSRVERGERVWEVAY